MDSFTDKVVGMTSFDLEYFGVLVIMFFTLVAMMITTQLEYVYCGVLLLVPTTARVSLLWCAAACPYHS